MSFEIPEKTIEIKCTEHAFSEFPELLYGSASDGTIYFDATLYLQNKNKTIYDFWDEYQSPVKSLLSVNSIPLENAFVLNQDDHVLIMFDLVYLFLCFVEPEFVSYVCDRINELFVSGFCISDTCLLRATSERLSNEILKNIINERKQ